MAELRNDVGDGFKHTGNHPTVDQYEHQFPLLWDAYKTRACVCDPKWTDVDCSRRMCPKGNYALYQHTEPTPEVQAIIISNVFTPETDGGNRRKKDPGYKVDTNLENLGNTTNGEFALTFRSTLGEEFTTTTLNVYSLTEEIVADALNKLPNKVIEDAEVVLFRNISKFPDQADWKTKLLAKHKLGHGMKDKKKLGYPADPKMNYTSYAHDLVILVTYSGAMTTGNQYALECKTAYCSDGCQPRLLNPLDFKEGSACTVVNDYTEAYGVNVECAGRGSCDYTSGTCSCYQGYTDEYCSTQTALI